MLDILGHYRHRIPTNTKKNRAQSSSDLRRCARLAYQREVFPPMLLLSLPLFSSDAMDTLAIDLGVSHADDTFAGFVPTTTEAISPHRGSFQISGGLP